jgi:hypothetical protein
MSGNSSHPGIILIEIFLSLNTKIPKLAGPADSGRITPQEEAIQLTFNKRERPLARFG